MNSKLPSLAFPIALLLSSPTLVGCTGGYRAPPAVDGSIDLAEVSRVFVAPAGTDGEDGEVSPQVSPRVARQTEGAAITEEDDRISRPASWTRIVARTQEHGPSVAVFEAASTVDAAREDLTRQLAVAGYQRGPVLADDASAFWRNDLRLTAVFVPLGRDKARVSVAVVQRHSR